MPFVYTDANKLQGQEKVGSGDCVDLVKHFVPGLNSLSARVCWRPGARVIDTRTLARGTAIATFTNDRYPNGNTGQHAALFLAHAGPNSFWVMDQWRGKKAISKRLIYGPRPGIKQRPDGSWPDASNVGPAFSVIELSCGRGAK